MVAEPGTSYAMNNEQKETLIDDVFANHQEALMSISGVVGVGIGEIGNSPAIVVMLREIHRS